MTPPPTSPKKRMRPRRDEGTTSSRYTPKSPPRKDWSFTLHNFRTSLITLYTNFAAVPLGEAERHTPEIVLIRYNSLRSTLTDIVNAVEASITDIIEQRPDLLDLAPCFNAGTQTDELPLPQPAIEEPLEAPLLRTYASVATNTSPIPRQAKPRPPPSTPRVKPAAAKSTTTKPLNPVRVAVQLKHNLTLPIRETPPPELFRQLSEACAKAPSAPAPLGAHWNRNNNLIITFPAGTTRSSIKTLFPAIHSLVGSAEKPVILFDVPWCKLHLANIRARDSPDLPLSSEEELRHTLLRNPIFQTLDITVQPTWLKKPDCVNGTHTSAVFMFEDQNGLIERALLKSTIFAFGERVAVKKWHTSSTLPQH